MAAHDRADHPRSLIHSNCTFDLCARKYSVCHSSRGCEEGPGGRHKKTARPKGLRDYAILTLLSTYGVRAGEITALRLDDVDWRKEIVRIRHSKTGAISYLPLLPEVGEAVLKYLQDSRPKTHFREMFIRSKAPYRPFTGGSSLHGFVRRPARSRQRDHHGQTRSSYFSSCTSCEHAARGGTSEGDRRSAGPSCGGFNIGLSEAGDGGLACRGHGDSDGGESMKTVSMSSGNATRLCPRAALAQSGVIPEVTSAS